jgi:hypothetical protein
MFIYINLVVFVLEMTFGGGPHDTTTLVSSTTKEDTIPDEQHITVKRTKIEGRALSLHIYLKTNDKGAVLDDDEEVAKGVSVINRNQLLEQESWGVYTLPQRVERISNEIASPLP